MKLAPQFLTLTRGDGRPLTLNLGYVVALVGERRPAGLAHDDDCPSTSDDPDHCACPWVDVAGGTRITLAGGRDVRVREAYDDVITLISARMAAVIDGAGIIARAYGRVEVEQARAAPSPALESAITAEQAADAAREARMEALEGRR